MSVSVTCIKHRLSKHIIHGHFTLFNVVLRSLKAQAVSTTNLVSKTVTEPGNHFREMRIHRILNKIIMYN